MYIESFHSAHLFYWLWLLECYVTFVPVNIE